MPMSADNGIYILKTRDQYRIAHLQSAEYMNYSILTQNCNDEIIPTRAVELWGDGKFTRKENIALHIAHKWADSLPICEHGVNIVKYNNTWKELLKEAVKYAQLEIKTIEKRGNENDWNMEHLQKIADGIYLSEWIHREQYDKALRKHDCGYWSVCYKHGCKCSMDKNINGFDNK